MVVLMAGAVPDEWTQHESYYQTKYGQWNGFVARIPVLRQIIDIRAASVFSSWRIKGSHENQATTMLDDMEGRGNETFKEIMSNLYRIAYICGDAYAEKIYDGDNIVDLEILPSDNIRQVIEKGKIKRFEEINGEAKWKPYKIFHIRYLPRGAMTHGIGMIESMNNLLVTYEQMLQLLAETYERQSRPRELILTNTDNKAKMDIIRDAVKEAGDAWSGIAILPKQLIDDVKDITMSPSLRPEQGLDAISKEIFKATATPELILGTGYSTSEEDATTRIAGFMGSIRYDQECFEEFTQRQIFREMWPTNPPEIEYSFTHEAYDAMFNRNMAALPVIEGLQTVAPENKLLIIKEKLKEMGIIQ